MQREKVERIIERKNQQAEEDAGRNAGYLVQEILGYQAQIKILEEQIASRRKDLTELEVEQIDPAAVLGE